MPLVQTHPSIPATLDDLILWPDGSYCEREDLLRGQHSDKSDDYEVLAEGTEPWFDFAIEHNLIQPI